MRPRAGQTKLTTSMAAMVAATVLAAACSSGPSDDDYAQLIIMNNPELADVVIDDIDDGPTNWKVLTGTAVLGVDLFDEPNEEELGQACGASSNAAYQVRGPWGPERNVLVLEPGQTAGTPVDFVFEIVASQVTVGEADSDGDVYQADDVTSGGWTLGAYGGTYEIDGTPDFYLGAPAERYGGLDAAVIVGTPTFDVLCQEIVAADG